MHCCNYFKCQIKLFCEEYSKFFNKRFHCFGKVDKTTGSCHISFLLCFFMTNVGLQWHYPIMIILFYYFQFSFNAWLQLYLEKMPVLLWFYQQKPLIFIKIIQLNNNNNFKLKNLFLLMICFLIYVSFSIFCIFHNYSYFSLHLPLINRN